MTSPLSPEALKEIAVSTKSISLIAARRRCRAQTRDHGSEPISAHFFEDDMVEPKYLQASSTPEPRVKGRGSFGSLPEEPQREKWLHPKTRRELRKERDREKSAERKARKKRSRSLEHSSQRVDDLYVSSSGGNWQGGTQRGEICWTWLGGEMVQMLLWQRIVPWAEAALSHHTGNVLTCTDPLHIHYTISSWQPEPETDMGLRNLLRGNVTHSFRSVRLRSVGVLMVSSRCQKQNIGPLQVPTWTTSLRTSCLELSCPWSQRAEAPCPLPRKLLPRSNSPLATRQVGPIDKTLQDTFKCVFGCGLQISL